jgi:hypothetical protein
MSGNPLANTDLDEYGKIIILIQIRILDRRQADGQHNRHPNGVWVLRVWSGSLGVF